MDSLSTVPRKTLDIKVFHVTFDEVFWHRIIEWMTTQTEYEGSW